MIIETSTIILFSPVLSRFVNRIKNEKSKSLFTLFNKNLFIIIALILLTKSPVEQFKNYNYVYI